MVENTIAELKHFRVLADRFRHSVDIYDDVFGAVVAIVNPRISRRVAVASVAQAEIQFPRTCSILFRCYCATNLVIQSPAGAENVEFVGHIGGVTWWGGFGPDGGPGQRTCR